MQTLIPEPAQATALLAALFAFRELAAARLIERHLGHYGVLRTWTSPIRPAFAEIATTKQAASAASTSNIYRPGR